MTRRRHPSLRRYRPLGALALALLAACGDPAPVPITEVRDRARPEYDTPPTVTSAERFIRAFPRAARPPARPTFRWQTPDGWREVAVRPMQMREASFEVPGEPPGDCSLSMSGGTPLDNVNRWRRQMSLDPIDAAALARLPRRPFVGQADALLVDLAGTHVGMRGDRNDENFRLLGLIAETGGTGVFLKLVGPADVVAANEAAFEQLAGSVERADTGSGARAERPTSPGRDVRDRLRWDDPAGWTSERPKQPGIRLATLRSKAQPELELVISVAGGALQMNVDMWRGQMGLGPLPADQIDQLETVDVLDRKATLVRIEGRYQRRDGAVVEDGVLLAIACPLETGSVFLKLVGPAEEVAAAEEALRALAASLRLEA